VRFSSAGGGEKAPLRKTGELSDTLKRLEKKWGFGDSKPEKMREGEKKGEKSGKDLKGS